jgi:hypothetical protein
MKNTTNVTPPNTDISIVHIVKKLYATIYQIGIKLPKYNKLGIHSDIEHVALETITFIIKASLASRTKKVEPLEQTRINLELLKHLIRTEHELKIITEKQYIYTESMLIETSKMTNGWIKFLTQNPTK